MSRTDSVVRRALNIYRSQGLKILLVEIRRKIWDCRKTVWLVRDLSEVVPRDRTPLPVEIDFSHPEETIDWLAKQNMLGTADPRELEVACEYKHFLPSVRREGKIAGYLKIGFEKIYVLDFKREFVFPPTVAFIYDTYVAPELRGKRIATFLIDRVCEFMKQKGYSEIYCHIRVKNLASIRAYEKSGFRPVRVISWFSFLGMSFFSFPPERLWSEHRSELGD